MDQMTSAYDVEAIRRDFPILSREVYGKPLVYLDNGASAQKPQVVIDAISRAYSSEYANVHRGLHFLSNAATDAYEKARETTRRFLNAASVDEIVFTKNATEAINTIAYGWGMPNIGEGDEIVLSIMEHHSNIVPWQLAGARTVAAPINDDGSLDMEGWRARLNDRTRLVAVGHVSNTLGIINPIHDIIQEAHARGIPVLVDGAQSLAHLEVDLHAWDVDFFVSSAHKTYGPTGFGLLYGKRALLEDTPPWHGGGDMIETVAFEGSTWNTLPYKFEAGTPDIAGAVGFAAALDWLGAMPADDRQRHEEALLAYGNERLATVPGLSIIGTHPHKSAIFSLVMEGAHPHDLGALLNEAGVAVRTGHHCTMPLMKRFGVPATARASLALYSGTDDIDQLVDALNTARRLLTA